MSRIRAAALGAAGLLALLCVLPAATAARPLLRHGRQLQQNPGVPLPCAVVGGPAGPEWMDAPLTCLQFHSLGAPIGMPADTNTTKYGQLYVQSRRPLVIVFVDRTGARYAMSPDSGAPTDPLQVDRVWNNIMVQAQLDPTSNNVTSFSPQLYVPYA